MKARPILMSAPMVRALLDGRKSQTRRVIGSVYGRQVEYLKDEGPVEFSRHFNDPMAWGFRNLDDGADAPLGVWADLCPYGVKGDLLWVRESWAYVGTCDPGYLTYKATYPHCLPTDVQNVPEDIKKAGYRWTPSIHMPRKHSRLTLEIISARAERLNEISETDAIAEGCRPFFDKDSPETLYGPNGDGIEMAPLKGPVDAYMQLWESINGTGSWENNPWVWAIEFKIHRQNVEQLTNARAA